jgi:hypothetical protein
VHGVAIGDVRVVRFGEFRTEEICLQLKYTASDISWAAESRFQRELKKKLSDNKVPIMPETII